MKKIWNYIKTHTWAQYLLVLAAGIMIQIIVTPYAKAWRNDPALHGGERLIALAAVTLFAMGKSVAKDIRSGLFSPGQDPGQDDNDNEGA